MEPRCRKPMKDKELQKLIEKIVGKERQIVDDFVKAFVANEILKGKDIEEIFNNFVLNSQPDFKNQRARYWLEMKDETSYDPDFIANLKKQKNLAYWERNQLIAYLSKLFPSWIEKSEIKEKGYKFIVNIQTPEKNCRWHIPDEELHFFDHLEHKKENTWDRSNTLDKYEALRRKK